MKKANQGTKSDFESKQKEIELEHKSTVNKIKSEIWGDRLAFLQKMIKLADEGKQDSPVQEVQTPKDKPAVKAQALAQASTKGMTQDDEEKDNKNGDKKIKLNQTSSKSKNKKEDLINRIDKQLARLKSKNQEKESEAEGDQG